MLQQIERYAFLVVEGIWLIDWWATSTDEQLRLGIILVSYSIWLWMDLTGHIFEINLAGYMFEIYLVGYNVWGELDRLVAVQLPLSNEPLPLHPLPLYPFHKVDQTICIATFICDAVFKYNLPQIMFRVLQTFISCPWSQNRTVDPTYYCYNATTNPKSWHGTGHIM